MLPDQFKGFEPVMDIIKAANLIIGAATLIYKVYVPFLQLIRQAVCAVQAARGKPCEPPAPPPAPPG